MNKYPFHELYEDIGYWVTTNNNVVCVYCDCPPLSLNGHSRIYTCNSDRKEAKMCKTCMKMNIVFNLNDGTGKTGVIIRIKDVKNIKNIKLEFHSDNGILMLDTNDDKCDMNDVVSHFQKLQSHASHYVTKIQEIGTLWHILDSMNQNKQNACYTMEQEQIIIEI